MTPTPVSLLERLRSPGEGDAWGRFVDLYTPLLYFWACRMGLQAADAADLVQDVFSVLLEKLPAFQHGPGRGFRAWLRTVTVNRWRDSLRRKAAAIRGTASGLDEAAAPDEAAPFWEDEYRRQLVGRAAELLRGEFQPQTWRACWAVAAEGKAPAAVAAELGMSVASVYAAKSRVLRRLRQELEGLLE
jgi:RNA polymerase sigma-70 factor (ECF subfamily)